MKFIIAKKIEMSQVFDENGTVHPVTWLEAGPVVVSDIRTRERDGYEAVQVGFGVQTPKHIKKPQRASWGEIGNPRMLREFRIAKSDLKRGDRIAVSLFQEGDIVHVRAVSKGKGFQGVVKRHGFKGGPRTHGQKHSEREPGSIGAVWPQRVLKGMRMAGRMGGTRVSVRNLPVIKILPEKNLIAIGGAVPGRRGSVVEIYES